MLCCVAVARLDIFGCGRFRLHDLCLGWVWFGLIVWLIGRQRAWGWLVGVGIVVTEVLWAIWLVSGLVGFQR